MSKAPFLMMTIPSRIKLAEMTTYSLVNKGVARNRIHLFMGVNTKEAKEKGDNRPPQKIVAERILSGWFKEAIQIMNKDNAKGIWWIEDGVALKKKPDELIRFSNKITWHGWLKNLKHYTVGSKLIYFPKHIAEDIYRNHLEGRIPLGHTDRIFRNYGLKHNALHISKTTSIALFKYQSGTGTKKQQEDKAKWKQKFEVPTYKFRVKKKS